MNYIFMTEDKQPIEKWAKKQNWFVTKEKEPNDY